MNIHNQTIEIIELKETELKSQQLLLMKKAKKASKNAYAPYSEYKVGAAVLLQNNKIITGNNQENAAYPSGLCAERIAVFASKSLYPNTEILKIAIHIDNKKPIQKAVMPCGSCRQSIANMRLSNQKILKF